MHRRFQKGHNLPSQSRGGFRHTKKGQPKPLDERLFINKAQPIKVDEDPISTTSFADFQISEKLKRNIAEKGFINATPIQEQTIPPLLQGRDVIGIANTGTGKTAAFLIPLIEKISQDRNQRALIMTPTRELAMQIADELQIFTRGMDMPHVLCIGGTNMQRQEKKLHHNPYFVIGTPGRLKDLIQRKTLNLNLFQNIVLDEVDRMVDIGFIRDIQFVISLLPKKRQSLFFSATISDKERQILQGFVTDPVSVSVKKQETSANIEQDIVRVQPGEQKIDVLHNLLASDGFDKVLVFGRTKWGIEKLTRNLIERGFRAAAIHGNKSQGQRQRALEQFKNNQLQVLLATDVASRGLDIENVSHVINYDAPTSYEDYVHRIGRTGRADRRGVALTFVQ
ncbi:MAG TPA: DEAD/DEAH box helicase [Patescibacteria group bacterium]|nr:DEAD/DEAH box helicase [Patescibacteria group bacterium]